MTAKRLHALSISIALFAALVPACKTSGELDVEVGVTGTYELSTIEGNPIPYAPMHLGRQQPTVTAGDLTLNEGGTFSSSMHYSNDTGRTMTRTFAGRYWPEDDAYILKWEGAGTTRITIDGDELTMNNEGMLFVYKK